MSVIINHKIIMSVVKMDDRRIEKRSIVANQLKRNLLAEGDGVGSQLHFLQYVRKSGSDLTSGNARMLISDYMSDMRSKYGRLRQLRDPARNHLQNKIGLSTYKIATHIIPTLKNFIGKISKQINKKNLTKDQIGAIKEHLILTDIKNGIKPFYDLYKDSILISDDLKKLKSIASNSLEKYVEYIEKYIESTRDELNHIQQFQKWFSTRYLNLLDEKGKNRLLENLEEIQKEIDQFCNEIIEELQNEGISGQNLQQIFVKARDERGARECLNHIEKLHQEGSLSQIERYVGQFRHKSSPATLQLFQQTEKIDDIFSRHMQRYQSFMTPLMKDIVFQDLIRTTNIAQIASQDRIWSEYIQFLFEAHGKNYVESVIVIDAPYPTYRQDHVEVSALELAILTAIQRNYRAYVTVIAFQLIDAGARPVFNANPIFRDTDNFFLYLCIIAFENQLISQDEISILLSFESIATTICPSVITTIIYSEKIAPDDKKKLLTEFFDVILSTPSLEYILFADIIDKDYKMKSIRNLINSHRLFQDVKQLFNRRKKHIPQPVQREQERSEFHRTFIQTQGRPQMTVQRIHTVPTVLDFINGNGLHLPGDINKHFMIMNISYKDLYTVFNISQQFQKKAGQSPEQETQRRQIQRDHKCRDTRLTIGMMEQMIKLIKNKYRQIARRLHPDKGGEKQDFISLNTSYQLLIEYCNKCMALIPKR